MAKTARKDDDQAALHARIAELEAEVARLQVASENKPLTKQQNTAEAERSDISLALAELEAVYQVMPTGMAVLDGELRYVRVNETLAQMNGVPMADHIGRTVREIVPEIADSVEAIFHRVFETGKPMDALEFEAPTPGTREPRVWLENATPLKDAQGRSQWVLVTVLDITDRKRAEEAVAKSEAYWRGLFERLHEGFVLGEVVRDESGKGVDWRFIELNAAWENLTGLSREAAQGRTIREVMPGIEEVWIDSWVRVVDTGEPANVMHWAEPLGRWYEAHAFRLEPERFGILFVDITDRQRAEEALREREASFRRMADTAPALLWVTDSDNYCTYLSRSWYEFTGQTQEEALGFGWLDAVHPDDSEASGHAFLEATERRDLFRVEYRLKRADGSYCWAIDAGRPHFSETGEYLGYVGSVIDIDERKTAEAELQESEARFRAAVHAVSGVLWTNNADGQMTGEQPGWAALTGQTFKEYQGYGWAKAVHSEDTQASLEAWNAAVAERKTFVFEHRLRCADGRWRRFAIRAIPVLHQNGAIHEWVGVHTDVTDQREAEAVLSRDKAELEHLVEERTAALLREVEERRKAEEALRQGEKLQAIGQLTGGIAHDFNNIIQVVASGATLLGHAGLTEQRRKDILKGMTKATQSAKELTSRLLAFARKQSLQPEAFELQARLAGMSELLRHTLGSLIWVQTDFNQEPWLVHADPGQLEIALLNLAVNARDAMLPEGGTLTLQTRNAHLPATSERLAGEYVCLAVKDTGRGMPPGVLARVFEPFFTTKGPDQGTGLGLAQVHGFAKQSGGDIAVESVPGQGTTIILHLPRATAAQISAVPERAMEPAGAALLRTAGQTVLVVEDNPDVASFAASMLEGLGYATRRAGNAGDALMLLAEEPVDAVFSDVVMPGEVNGLQLASILRMRHPHIAVVLATGYSEALTADRTEAVAEVLHKPYRLDDLAAALERAFAAIEASPAANRQS